jgi:hypothetical protein
MEELDEIKTVISLLKENNYKQYYTVIKDIEATIQNIKEKEIKGHQIVRLTDLVSDLNKLYGEYCAIQQIGNI